MTTAAWRVPLGFPLEALLPLATLRAWIGACFWFIALRGGSCRSVPRRRDSDA